MNIVYTDDPREYRIDGERWRSVTQIIGSVFGTNYEHAPTERLEEARKRGIYVHKCCELYDQDDLDLDDVEREYPEYLPYVKCWIDFRRQSGFIPLDNELRVAHRELRYAGTLDKRGVLFGRMAILDIKTVAKVFMREARVQTAAYAMAAGDLTVDRYIVQLRKNKEAKLIPCKNPRDYLAWRDVVSLDNWQRTE